MALSTRKTLGHSPLQEVAEVDIFHTEVRGKRLPVPIFDQCVLDALLLAAWGPWSKFPSMTVKKVVKFLLEQGASANNVMDSTYNGHTLLYGCVRRGELEKVEMLLKYGADPNHRYMVRGSTLQESYLFTAVQSDNQPMVALLLKYGARLSTSVACEALNMRKLDMLRLLLDSGQSCSATNTRTGLTLLETSLRNNALNEECTWTYKKGKRRKFLDTFCKTDRKFIQLLVERGSPAPSAAVLRECLSSNAFVTLFSTYHVFLDAKRRLIWPEDLTGMTSRVVPKDVEVIILKVANILKELIRRTCTLSDNSGVMVRYLEELTGQTDKNANFPKLADLARSTVIGALKRLPVSRTLQETVGGMVMPWVFKEQLCLIDLARRLEAAKKL